jgi:hypothetical protein
MSITCIVFILAECRLTTSLQIAEVFPTEAKAVQVTEDKVWACKSNSLTNWGSFQLTTIRWTTWMRTLQTPQNENTNHHEFTYRQQVLLYQQNYWSRIWLHLDCKALQQKQKGCPWLSFGFPHNGFYRSY